MSIDNNLDSTTLSYIKDQIKSRLPKKEVEPAPSFELTTDELLEALYYMATSVNCRLFECPVENARTVGNVTQKALAYIQELQKTSEHNVLNIKCPECGKTLQVMNVSHELIETENCLKILCWCENCKDGIDRDFDVTYTKENGVKEIKRHFWG